MSLKIGESRSIPRHCSFSKTQKRGPFFRAAGKEERGCSSSSCHHHHSFLSPSAVLKVKGGGGGRRPPQPPLQQIDEGGRYRRGRGRGRNLRRKEKEEVLKEEGKGKKEGRRENPHHSLSFPRSPLFPLFFPRLGRTQNCPRRRRRRRRRRKGRPRDGRKWREGRRSERELGAFSQLGFNECRREGRSLLLLLLLSEMDGGRVGWGRGAQGRKKP